MKIGFVGVNFVTKHLLNELAEKYEVVAWSKKRTDEPFSKKIKFIQINTSWEKFNKWFYKRGSQRSLPYYMKGLIPSLWKEKPDVVVVMDYFRLWFIQSLIYALFYPKTKLVIHSETKRTPPNLITKSFFFFMSLIVFLFQWRIKVIFTYSNKGTDYLKKIFPFVRIEKLLLPIDENTPTYSQPTEGDTVNVLVPARFIPLKRHLDIIKAVENMQTQSKIKIDFANFKPNNSYFYPEIKAALEKSVAKHTTSFVEEIEEPFDNYYQLLEKYDVVLLASESEGLGAVIPAAMRCGRTVIVSEGVTFSENITNGTHGYIFPVGDIDSLTKILDNLDKKQVLHMGQKARELMYQDLSKENCTAKFIENII